MSGFVERHHQSSNIQWGKLVAGAAVASGIVLVGLAIGNNEVPILSQVADGVQQVASNIYEGIREVVTGIGAAAPPSPELGQGSEVFKAFGQFLTDIGTFLTNNAKSLGGAALLAAGLGYFTVHADIQQYEEAPVPAEAKSRLQNMQMGFAAREQMRAVNALMESRMHMMGRSQDTGIS